MARSVTTIAGVSKSFNDRGLREFCPEGHRVFWPAHMTALGRKDDDGQVVRGSICTGDVGYSGYEAPVLGKINRGVCTVGDLWVQQRSDITTVPAPGAVGLDRTRMRVATEVKPRTGMETGTAPGDGSYDVSYNLNRETGQVVGHATLKCALGHVDQRAGRKHRPMAADADSRGWVHDSGPTPVPDTLGEMNAFVSGLLAEGWELRDNRLLCPQCVVEFDELAHGLGNARAVERLENETAPVRYEYRVRRRADFEHMFKPYSKDDEPRLVEGEVVTIATEAEIAAARAEREHGFYGGTRGDVVIRRPSGRLVSAHPSLIKRVKIETDD